MSDAEMLQAKAEVERLVQKYKQFAAADQLKKQGEEDTKKNFITPLFRALGWDVENDKNLDEVINEENVSRKRVDYSFRINGIPRFFLEAKALKVGLDEAKDAAQAINYAWHKGASWAVLTDFKTLCIYNAEVKEKNLADARFITLTCDQFIDQFERLWWLSKPAFLEGRLDKEAMGWGKKLRKTRVGDQLLQELMQHRTALSKNILKNNAGKNLSEDDIDEAVQRILDRMIFIRTTEDRQIESPLLLPAAREFEEKKRGKLTTALNEIYLHYDQTYDSRLFTYEPTDISKRHLCESLEIDNETLIPVINGLYISKDGLTHYDFSAIDADVLGNMYEQYLSHILRKTEKRAKVESKEAHRKEQGIYYTPTYIVDYIVRNTLGEVLKTTKPKDAENLKVLDMACGSGSFLLRAFDTFDAYYKKRDKDYAQTKLDTEHETARITRKIRTLKNNIYGVDLDPKAIEIAQLNLLLKTAETKHRLPDLRENLKCGNSLIDDPAVAGDHAFNWNKEFEEIMKNGGFDIIVGNPPYIRPHKISNVDKQYFWNTFGTFKAKSDIFVCFIERGIKLLRQGAVISFIVPHTWTSLESFVHLRQFIFENCKILKLVQLPKKVFQEATVETCIFVLEREYLERKRLTNDIIVERLDSAGNKSEIKRFKQSKIRDNYLYNFELYSENSANTIFQKLDRLPRLGSVTNFAYGLKTGDDPKFISSQFKDSNSKPLVRSADVTRYRLAYHNEFVWYVPDVMTKNKVTARPGDKERFEQPKLIIGRMGKQLFGTYDSQNYYVKDGMLLTSKSNAEPLLYLLGLINSKLLNYYYRNFFVTIDVLKNALLNLPIPVTNASKKAQVAALVEQLLVLNLKITNLGDKSTDERTRLEKDARTLDQKIDELVYDLYGLTAEERKIVEEAVK